MAVSQNQRLRKAAAKAAKRKAVAAKKLEADRREWAISKPRHIDFAASPIVACTVTHDYQTTGMGTLLVARKLTHGRFGMSCFLLDMWCLGIKDAYFRVLDGEDYEIYTDEMNAAAPSIPMAPDIARKLVRDAVAYGKANGFPPPDDFADLERIFGDVAPAEATFTFGVEGKPYYKVSPYDPPARVRRIFETLEFNLGRAGFQYEYPLEDEFDDEELDDDAGLIEGELAPDAPEAEDPPTPRGAEKA